MESLNTQTVVTQFNAPMVSANYSTGAFNMQVPQSSVMIPKPLSYEFRVVEYEDKEGNITQVGLQIATFEHDNYGVRQLRQDWTPVKRVRLPSGT